MSDQFRYKLNKKMFKGKKVPPKIRTNEDHISPDQRGDRSSSDPSLLNLSKTSISKTKSAEEEKDVSRRGLFSGLDRLKEFADGVEKREKDKELLKKYREAQEAKTAKPSESAEEELTEEEESSSPEEEPPKKGFFSRILSKFRKSDDSASETETGETETEPVEQTITAKSETKRKEVDPEPEDDEEEEEEERDEEDVEMSRRNLMRKGAHFFAKPAVDTVQRKIDKINHTVNKITKRVPLLRPPGAISEREFLNACSRCDECSNACPKDAIRKAPKKMGFLIFGTPYIDPAKTPCVMCDGLPCISACPDKALMPVPSPADVEMGYAILDKNKCQAYGVTFCQQCVIDCPIPGAITQKDSKPTIHKKICTGCGVCVNSCGTVNIPVAIKIKPQMVIESQIRKREMEKARVLLEAKLKAEREAEDKEEDSANEATDIPQESESN